MSEFTETVHASWAVGLTTEITATSKKECVNVCIDTGHGIIVDADDARFMAQQLLICANKADEGNARNK